MVYFIVPEDDGDPCATAPFSECFAPLRRQEEPPLANLAVTCHREESASHHSSPLSSSDGRIMSTTRFKTRLEARGKPSTFVSAGRARRTCKNHACCSEITMSPELPCVLRAASFTQTITSPSQGHLLKPVHESSPLYFPMIKCAANSIVTCMGWATKSRPYQNKPSKQSC